MALLSGLSLYATDLSQYRQFQLDSGLTGVAEQAGMKPSEAELVHERPAVLQELSWRAEPTDSVEQVLFSFHNGDLYRMVVEYSRHNTEGLTAEDMIAAISEDYGPPSRPRDEMSLSSIYNSAERVQVMARWQDNDWSFNLVRSKYKPTFNLVVLSKRWDIVAHATAEEAIRLDRAQAPQRALDLQKVAEEEKRLQAEKARESNKSDFRP